jgi:hypothetical protein
MIDYFNLPVLDLARSRHFFEQALAPLGFRFLMQDGNAIGFGGGTWGFGIVATPPPIPRIHLAFQAGSRAMVELHDWKCPRWCSSAAQRSNHG